MRFWKEVKSIKWGLIDARHKLEVAEVGCTIAECDQT